MAATPRNPRGGGNLPPVSDFPAGSAGQMVFHSEFGESFVNNGVRWRTVDGGAGVYPCSEDVDVHLVVRLVDGTLEVLDLPAVAGAPELRATGIVVSIVGGDALVRWEGEVDDFAGLSVGATYCAAANGSLTTNPSADHPILRMGEARSATRLYVHIDQPLLV